MGGLKAWWLQFVLRVITSRVTRFEVVDVLGRAYVARSKDISLSLQDEGRTLKVFVKHGGRPWGRK